MKDFYEINGYTQWVNNRDQTFSCTCPDFTYRKLKKDGDKTIAIGKCKHLILLEPKKLTEKQKEVLRELVNHICEVCNQMEEKCGKLTAHRLNRGYKGGRYIPRNIQMICNDCHKKIHGREFK